MKAIVTNFMFQIPTGSISFSGIQSEAAGWVSAIIAIVIMFLVLKHFTKGSIGQLVISILVGGLVYFVVKNPDSVLNSVGGIFKTIFG
ncbi:TcpD family membrane protein [Leuconostoc falkenbergense]|uniref:TcpD family membrane protein n=1 Tax=Leuconostoc falkenbergense TaxID=2766470 RepID=UPI001664886F|nr:TcpD family membrane protein [Leuconostoc falkenbergense]